MLSWSRDQTSLYFKSILQGMGRNTMMIPLPSGEALPRLRSSGLQSDRDLLTVTGVQMIEEEDVFPGSSPAVYAFTRKTAHRNLYRISIQ